MPITDDIDQIERGIEEMESDEERLAYLSKRTRRLQMLSHAVFVIVLLPFAFLFAGIGNKDVQYGFAKGGVVIAAGVVFLTRLLIDAKIDDHKADQKMIYARRRVQEQLPSEEPPNNGDARPAHIDYFDNLVKINVENLAAYYELVKVQTDKSFKASLWVAYFGALLIVVGLGLGFFRTDAADKITYIATGSGVLTEFIAGVFFWLYTKTVSQLRGYHDSLLLVQNILLSFKLVSETEDLKEKSQMVSMMCQSLLSVQAAQTAARRTSKPAATARGTATKAEKKPDQP